MVRKNLLQFFQPRTESTGLSHLLLIRNNMIKNKYSRLYHRIIASAQNRDVPEGYYERHHITPRSLGGTDSKSNLVEVTAREHFILHYLLTKFTEGPDFRKMVNAFNMMNCSSDGQHRYMNSRLYDANRKHMSETMRVNQTGAKNSQFGKIWMTNSIINKSSRFDLNKININELLEQGWVKGRFSTTFKKNLIIPSYQNRKHSDETRRKISLARRGKSLSETHRENISIGIKNGRGVKIRT